MVILEWFPLLNESALQLIPVRNANSELLLAYLLISVLTKRASLLAAFFMGCMLFELSIFDQLSEASLYLLTFAIYSYVITCKALTFKQRIACGIILTLSIILAYDAYHYGINGTYGATETFVYNNIEYLASCAHIIFISSFIPITRIRNYLRSFIASVGRIAVNSDYMLIYWYNVSKATNQKQL